MELKYNESVGYRVDASNVDVKEREALLKGIVTVYAERTNNQTVLGEYGGDAYPAVYENTDGKNTYGMVLAADGVGNAAFTHPSLENYLTEKIESFCADVKNDEAKLSLFLRTLYGGELFEEENKDALDYALKSFAPVPTDGFYVSDKFKWDSGSAQKVMPFYKRESQWLGSRSVCVGLYLKFRKAFVGKNIDDIDEKFCEKLKKDIEGYIYGELKTNMLSMISYDDAPTTDKKMRYFLAATVAMWFYVSDGNIVRALSVNMGDARCYVSDLEDGVRQISIDDAFSNGTMAGFVHFGTTPKTTDGYCDGMLRARLVELKPPCMLMTCSDGVYDTCPEVKDKNGAVLGSSFAEPVDFLFEKNMLDAMRWCYSLDDFKREIVFNFYAHAATSKGISERRDGKYYEHVKRDDSGTLAARFFGKTPLELFDGLRKTKETAFDKLFDKIIELKKQGVNIPISDPHEQSQEEAETDKYGDCAIKLFGNAEFLNMVKTKLYVPAFDDMKKEGSDNLWGITVTDDKPLSGYSLNFKFFNIPNKIAILMTTIEDWKEVENNPALMLQWMKSDKHKHIIVNNDVKDCLEKADFDQIVEALAKQKLDSNNEDIEKFVMFEKCFMGEVGDRNKVDMVWGRGDLKELDKYKKSASTSPATEKSSEQEILDGKGSLSQQVIGEAEKSIIEKGDDTQNISPICKKTNKNQNS